MFNQISFTGFCLAIFVLVGLNCSGGESRAQAETSKTSAERPSPSKNVTGILLSPRELKQNRDRYLNKFVSVEGYLKECGPVRCTERKCGRSNPCCNGCSASLGLYERRRKHQGACSGKNNPTAGETALVIHNDSSRNSLSCNGTNCGLMCGPYSPYTKYRVTGRWVKKQNGTGLNGPILVYRLEETVISPAR